MAVLRNTVHHAGRVSAHFQAVIEDELVLLAWNTRPEPTCHISIILRMPPAGPLNQVSLSPTNPPGLLSTTTHYSSTFNLCVLPLTKIN